MARDEWMSSRYPNHAPGATDGAVPGPVLSAAFMLDQGGGWVAPTGLVGHASGGSLDGSRTNPWYGMFPQEWLDGVGEGGGDPEQAGSAWERRRKHLQRLGDFGLRKQLQRRTDRHPRRIDRSEAARGRARPRNFFFFFG